MSWLSHYGWQAQKLQTRQVANRVATTLRMAAQTLVRSHSALGAFYCQMQARLGAPKAITATVRKLARSFYHLWTSDGTYVDPGMETYEHQHQERVLKNLKKKA